MNQLEIEYKTLLSPKEFEHLATKYAHVPLVTQTNYYFDTHNFDLRKAKLSLRIRRLPDQAELTLKIPQKVGNLEHNMILDLEFAQEILDHNQLPLNAITQIILDRGIPLETVKNLGHLTTHRRETRIPIGLLALDENHYAGLIDYELELEVTDADQGKKDFDYFLRSEKIMFKYAKSKVARFVQTLKQAFIP